MFKMIKINDNAFCEFGKVLGSGKTCSFAVYQLRKNQWVENLVKNSNWRTRLLPYAPWLHVTCRIAKRWNIGLWVKSGLMKMKSCVNLSFFYNFRTEGDEFWAALNSAESEENRPEQLWNSSGSEKYSSETALNRADLYLQKRHI